MDMPSFSITYVIENEENKHRILIFRALMIHGRNYSELL